MLEFEHIVQVNDRNNDRLPDISREQLWEGLVLRARNPEKFNHALDCQSYPISDTEFMRTIEAGHIFFEEKVKLYPQDRICTHTVGDDEINAASTTTIEEPEDGFLFVRFSYRRELSVEDDRVDVAEHLKSAYVQVDRDAIALIRLLAECEILDEKIN
ncbi:MAG: DUF1857 family protein [Gammaproteobacteria bacterium]